MLSIDVHLSLQVAQLDSTQDNPMPALSPVWLISRPQETLRPPLLYQFWECRSISAYHLGCLTTLFCPRLPQVYYGRCCQSGNSTVLCNPRPSQQSFLGCTCSSHPLIASWKSDSPKTMIYLSFVGPKSGTSSLCLPTTSMAFKAQTRSSRRPSHLAENRR